MTDYENKSKFSSLIAEVDTGVCTQNQSQQLHIGKYDWLIRVRGKIRNWCLTDFANQPFISKHPTFYTVCPSLLSAQFFCILQYFPLNDQT